MSKLCKSVIAFSLMSLTSLSFATTLNSPSPVKSKTYELLELRKVTLNDPNCQSAYKNLKQLKKKPLTFQFSQSNNSTSLNLSDQSGKIQNHSYSTLSQSVNGSTITRVGMGSFILDQQAVQYVIVITGDAAQKDFQFLYPVILSTHNAHCYFSAVLKPDNNTQESFKKSITSGAVNNQKDLLN